MAEIINCPMCGHVRAMGHRCPTCGDMTLAQPAGLAVVQVANPFVTDGAPGQYAPSQYAPPQYAPSQAPPAQFPPIKAPYAGTGPLAVGPSGLGGWLVLPILGLFVSIIAILAGTFSNTIPIFRDGAWDVLTTPGTGLYHPWWAPVIQFECVTDAIFLVSSVILLVFLFQKRPVLPKLMVGYYGFYLVYIVIDSLIILWQGPEMLPIPELREEIGFTASSVLGDVTRWALVCAIWIPYFLMSKRVKNTFAAGLSGMQAERSRQWSPQGR